MTMSVNWSPRRPKGSARQNQNHTLIMGVGLFVLLLLLQPTIERWHERFFMPEHPIAADLRLFHQRDRVGIEYTVKVDWPVRAFWVGQIRDAADNVILTRRALKMWSYSPGLPKAKEWRWRAWWEDFSTNPTVLAPKEPFRICVRYDGVGRRGGTDFDTPYRCSELFDPTEAVQ